MTDVTTIWQPPRTPRGPARRCRTWQAEAALRLLLNNLDPQVAEDPARLIVYGGRGQAARSPEALEAIVRCLIDLGPEETLLVQSGKPVGIVPTHADAPRVLIANSNLVPQWATQEHFDELVARGLMMYGQMTAGSWIYIGTQGIVQGTFETFAECARQHFGGTLKGRVVVTAGCGGMGGAQPLAAVMAGAACLVADVDRARLQRRIASRYLDRIVDDPDAAIDEAWALRDACRAGSVGCPVHATVLLERLIAREFVPDVLTDQTSAHDLRTYVPDGMTCTDATRLAVDDGAEHDRRARQSVARHVRLMRELQSRGAVTFDYGNNIRQRAFDEGVEDAFEIPGFVPAYIRPQFCRGRGPFRWVALSGDPADIAATDAALLEQFPDDRMLHRWIRMAQERIRFQGLPARICWLDVEERAVAGLLFNRLVAEGRVSAPIAIGRDHLDCGSVASPNRETERMRDGSDAVSDWPLLNAMVSTASGASWVSLHHGGGVGIGFSQHAGLVVVADGTADAERRLARVLRNDPALGVLRHADAGYAEAIETAERAGLVVPMPYAGA